MGAGEGRARQSARNRERDPRAIGGYRVPAFLICRGLPVSPESARGWPAFLVARRPHYTHTRERSDSRSAGRGRSEDHHAGTVDPGPRGGVRGRGRPRRNGPHLHGGGGGAAVAATAGPLPAGGDGGVERRREPRG